MFHNLRSKWSATTVNRKIFSAMLTVGFMTLVSKGLVFVQVLVLAYFFGTGNALDAFFIAYLVPTFATTVIAQSFNVAFMPTYIQVRDQDGQPAAQRLLSTMMVASTVLLLGIMLLLALSSPVFLPVLGVGFTPDKLALTHSLFLIMLPILLAQGFATIWQAVLNAHESFALPALSPICTPLAVLLMLVMAAQTWGVYAVAVGTITGMAIEAAMLGWRLKAIGLHIRPHWYGWTPAVQQVLWQYLPMIAGAVMMSSTRLVDQSMATMLGPGSVASLEFGGKVIEGALLLGSTALGTALLPYVSSMVATADWSGVRSALKVYTRLILVGSLPVMLVLIVFSEPIIRVVFQRGAFDATDTQFVAKIQVAYALQTPFYLMSILIVRAISALKANHILMWGAGINMVANILFNYILIQFFGLVGIALSTSIVYLVSWTFVAVNLYILLRRENQETILDDSNLL